MATKEKQVEMSAKSCQEMENDNSKQTMENLYDDANDDKDVGLSNKDKCSAKDACASDNESDNFEDALEELKENLEKTDIEEKPSNKKDDGRSDDEDTYLQPSEPLTEEQKLEQKCLAGEHKAKGNEYFKRSEFPEAREYYTTAIKTCPPEFNKERAVFFSNRAACLVRMEMYEDAIKDSSKALECNPEYLKARLRRAQCYEHEDKLEEALEDYKKVLETDNTCGIAREAAMRLPEQIKVKHEKMKEEMIGKLKDLGNVFLKPFGLSTNNFNVQQDPNSGGYSINFQQ